MTSELLTVLAAAGLVTSGIGATSETRSSQSFPMQNLAVAQAPAKSSLSKCAGAKFGKASCGYRLAQADGDADMGHHHHRGGGWWDSPAALGIGAAIAVGVIVAVVETNNHNNGNQTVSN